ncbi:hypothetical protein bcgnr5380_34690 [Bacillus cereus]
MTARAHGYDINPVGAIEESITVIFGLEKEYYVQVMFLFVSKAADKGYVSYRLLVDRIA